MSITDFANVKIPKNRAQRQLLLSQIHDEAYSRGFREGQKASEESLKRSNREHLERERKENMNSLKVTAEALSAMAQALEAQTRLHQSIRGRD